MEIDMTNYLATLTTEELVIRLAQLEKLGKGTAARIAAGDRGDFVGFVIRKGTHVPSYSNEAGINIQRSAWRETRTELNRRAA